MEVSLWKPSTKPLILIEEYVNDVSHLKIETALKILCYHKFDFKKALEYATEVVEPDLLSSEEKMIFEAALPEERLLNYEGKMNKAVGTAPLAKMLPSQSSRTLVQYYYDNKKKQRLTSLDSVDLAEKYSIARGLQHLNSPSGSSLNSVRSTPLRSPSSLPSSRKRKQLFVSSEDLSSFSKKVDDDIPSPLKRTFTFDAEEIVVLKFCLKRFGLDFEKIAEILDKPSEEIQSFAEISNFFGIVSLNQKT